MTQFRWDAGAHMASLHQSNTSVAAAAAAAVDLWPEQLSCAAKYKAHESGFVLPIILSTADRPGQLTNKNSNDLTRGRTRHFV